MATSKKSYITIQEFVQYATEFEADSAQFYQDLKAQVHDPKSQELLGLLAEEEKRHQQTLQSYEGRENKGILQFPPNLTSLMPAIPPELPGVSECITLALAREKRSVEIYENAANIASGDFRDILQGLAQFEREHVAKVMQLKRQFT